MSEIEKTRRDGQLVIKIPAGADTDAVRMAIAAACAESVGKLATAAGRDLERLLTKPDDDEGVEFFHTINLPDGRRVEITISIDLYDDAQASGAGSAHA